MPGVDLERPDPGCVINRGVLESAHRLPGFILEGEEFDIHLDVMARHLFVVAPGVDLADARAARKPV